MHLVFSSPKLTGDFHLMACGSLESLCGKLLNDTHCMKAMGDADFHRSACCAGSTQHEVQCNSFSIVYFLTTYKTTQNILKTKL